MDDLGDRRLGRSARLDASQAVRPASVRFDLALFRRRIDETIARFPAEIVATAANLGSPDETPILILGMPRSGTTLVEQLISSHPPI